MFLKVGVTNQSWSAKMLLILTVNSRCPWQLDGGVTLFIMPQSCSPTGRILNYVRFPSCKSGYRPSHQPGGIRFARSRQRSFYCKKNQCLSRTVGKFFVLFFEYLSEWSVSMKNWKLVSRKEQTPIRSMTNDFSYRAHRLLSFSKVICQVTYCKHTGQYEGIQGCRLNTLMWEDNFTRNKWQGKKRSSEMFSCSLSETRIK